MTAVLALETSAAACSVAVVADQGATAERVLAHCRLAMARGHAEAVLPLAQQQMAAAGLAFSDLAAIAVSRGPGGFTGIRIGLAAARGLAFAAGVPCIGVTTLAALAAAVDPAARDRPLVAVLDTRRGDFYAQAFAAGAGGAPLGPPQAVAGSGLAALLGGGLTEGTAHGVAVTGDAAAAAVAALIGAGISAVAVPGGTDGPDALWVARLALAGLRSGDVPGPAMPLYLRPAAVTRPEVKLAPQSGR